MSECNMGIMDSGVAEMQYIGVFQRIENAYALQNTL